jgi:CBS domain-containing protein
MKAAVISFLSQVPPFSALPQEELEFLSTIVFRREFPASHVIYQQNVSQLQELSIIHTGRVEKYFQGSIGQKEHPEVFGPGETFGAISILLNNRVALRSVRTLEPTVLYHLPEVYFQELCRKYESFNEFYMTEFGKRMLNSGYATYLLRKPDENAAFQAADLSFTQLVRDVYSAQVNSCSLETPIREAAKSMSLFRRDYVLVMNRFKEPVGILTDADLRNRVVIPGRAVTDPVSAVMSAPPQEISAQAPAYEAILLMFRRKINHLVVRDEGRFCGIITMDQLLNAQGKSPFLFIQTISEETAPEGLRLKWGQTPGIINQLLRRGARPEIVGPVVSAIADAVSVAAIRLAIKSLGEPPARFAFVALGSEGRREQTLSTDQDNALIWEETAEAEAAEAYFLELGSRINDLLNEIGFAYCQGGIMARNPEWNRPLSAWKEQLHRWLRDSPVLDNVIQASVLFDSRTIYGDLSLLEELRSSGFDLIRDNSFTLLAQLSRAALSNKTPLGLFGSFQLVESEHGKGLNVKRAMQIISDFARVYAWQNRFPGANTEERLSHMRSLGQLSESEFQELHQAYFFLMRLRLQHQTRQILEGSPPDNVIPPDSLSKIERYTLKEIFRVIEVYQKRLAVVFVGTLNG